MSEIAVSRSAWAERITAAWRKSFEQIIETGRLLIEAKAALAHGEFLDMVDRNLPFGARTAERLMAVGNDPRFANATLGSELPASWRTLYELTKLADADFETRLADGSIHAGMTRVDAQSLLAGSRAAAPQSQEPQSFAAQMPVGDLVDTSPMIEGAAVVAPAAPAPVQTPEMTEEWILDQAKEIRARRLLERRGAILAAREENPLVGATVRDLEALAASGFKAGAILADPAWAFRTRSDAGKERSADMHYETQELDDILSLGGVVRRLSADHCCLFLCKVDWAPAQALAVIEEWGFKHITTAFTWAKLNPSGEGWHMGGGYWTRANPEEVWLATRGDPVRLNAGVRQLIVAPVGEHSEKPEDYWTGIEELVDGPYLELNARRARRGWVCWGNELPFADNAPLWRPLVEEGQPVRQKFNVITGEVVDLGEGEAERFAERAFYAGEQWPADDLDVMHAAMEGRSALSGDVNKVLTIDGKPADIPILLEHHPTDDVVRHRGPIGHTAEPAGAAAANHAPAGQSDEDDEDAIPGFLRRQA